MNAMTYKSIMKSGTIVLMGTIAANLINYSFNITMVRLLEPTDYATLIVIVSLITIISIPLGTATTIAAKYTPYILSRYNAYLQATTVLGVGILIVYLFLTPWMSGYFAIPNIALLLMSPIICFATVFSMNKGVLQGLRKIWIFSIVPIGESIVKLVCALYLVAAGYTVYGAIGGITIAVLGSSIITTAYLIKKYQKQKSFQSEKASHTPSDWKESAIVIFVSSLAIALLGNVDILAAKHFLPPNEAANYAVLAVMGRTISYASLIMIPILFPAMSQALRPQDAQILFTKGIRITLLICIIILALFALFPKTIILLLPGSRYLPVAPYLIYAGFAAALWSMMQVFVSFFIATNKKQFLAPLLICTLLQVIGIGIFNKSITEILTVINAIGITLLGCFIWILWRQKQSYENT